MSIAYQWCLEERGLSVGSEDREEASSRACTGDIAVAQLARGRVALPDCQRT